MKRMRSIQQIRLGLETARALQDSHRKRPTDDPVTRLLRADNEREILALEQELVDALVGQLEVVLDGTVVESHSLKVSFASRVLDGMQGAYRAMYAEAAHKETVSRNESSLALVATSPGSVALHLSTAPSQLDLLEDPIADRAIENLLNLLTAEDPADAGRTFAERTESAQLQAVIRLCGTFAALGGTIQIRWRGVRGERFADIDSRSVRQLATALAGQPGREVITVVGHLERASDRPTTRVKVVTEDESYSAEVPDELKDRVKAMLFEDVTATLSVDMSTRISTGEPKTRIELLDLQSAS
jgi:hypothetical protein